MNHPPDIQWIELANGTCEPAMANRLHAHLDQCPACRAMFEELTGLHRAMRSLDIAPAERDLTAGVLAAMEQAERPVAWRIGPMAWRMAASLLIAAGVGVGAGAIHRDVWAQAPVSETAIRQQLGLQELQDDSPTGLSDLLFTMPTDLTVEKGTAG